MDTTEQATTRTARAAQRSSRERSGATGAAGSASSSRVNGSTGSSSGSGSGAAAPVIAQKHSKKGKQRATEDEVRRQQAAANAAPVAGKKRKRKSARKSAAVTAEALSRHFKSAADQEVAQAQAQAELEEDEAAVSELAQEPNLKNDHEAPSSILSLAPDAEAARSPRRQAAEQKRDNDQLALIQSTAATAALQAELEKANAEVARLRSQLQGEQRIVQEQTETLNNLQDECTCHICMENIWRPFVLIPCGHMFCLSCLLSWFQRPAPDELAEANLPPYLQRIKSLARKKLCPQCRTRVVHAPVELWSIKTIQDVLNKGSMRAQTLRAIAPAPTDEDASTGIVLPPIQYGFEEKDLSAAERDEKAGITKQLQEAGEMVLSQPRGLWHDLFEPYRDRNAAIWDEADMVLRCSDCTGEIMDGYCTNCGRYYPPSDDEDDDELDDSDDEDAFLGPPGFHDAVMREFAARQRARLGANSAQTPIYIDDEADMDHGDTVSGESSDDGEVELLEVRDREASDVDSDGNLEGFIADGPSPVRRPRVRRIIATPDSVASSVEGNSDVEELRDRPPDSESEAAGALSGRARQTAGTSATAMQSMRDAGRLHRLVNNDDGESLSSESDVSERTSPVAFSRRRTTGTRRSTQVMHSEDEWPEHVPTGHEDDDSESDRGDDGILIPDPDPDPDPDMRYDDGDSDDGSF